MSGWLDQAAVALRAALGLAEEPELPDPKPLLSALVSSAFNASNSVFSVSMSSARSCVSIIDNTAKVLTGAAVAAMTLAGDVPVAPCMFKMSTVLMALATWSVASNGISTFIACTSAVDTATWVSACWGR